ncbi:MAG TPA: FtsX-like permease family protein [Acidimicrobiales bacterium]
MKRVFGFPAGPLSTVLAIVLAVAVGAVVVVALRNLVFLKIGLRNIPRRRGRSALIVLGLMLGTTIIASALLTGDTMARTIRSAVVESLGQTDETVTAGTNADVADSGLEAARPYFDAAPAIAAIDSAAKSLPVDGVMAAIIEPVAAQHADAGKTEPRITLFAPDAERVDAFGFTAIRDLASDEVLLNDEAAEELDAEAGSRVAVLAGGRVAQLRVAGVGEYAGVGTDGPAALVPLATAQALLDRPGQTNHVLVSNDGDELTGESLTADVEPAVDRAVAALGLEALPTKADGLEAADTTGNTFVQLFTTFGSFSMAAGILLIFLIFVMLAAERRPEMGMARAVGTQRRHLVQTFLYEGAVYDLAAAAVGAVLGIGVSYVMVRAVATTFTDEGVELTYSLSGRSLLIAYAMGVLLTLIVVTVSAWRVSRLNIVSAIRDIPEEAESRHRRLRWLFVGLGILLGGGMAASGATGKVYLPWMLGISIVILSAVPIIKLLGRSERLAYTAAGGLLIVLWMLPMRTFDSLFGHMSKDFSIWIASGLIIVVAATWLITYNADVLLGLVSRLASPFKSVRPIAKMAVAYPLRSRFRTGVTMSMFMLVVFTMVTGSTIPSAFISSFDDVERFGGGFDIEVTTAPSASVDDLKAQLPPAVANDVAVSAAHSFLPVEARQADADRPLERYPIRGVDEAFLANTSYELMAMASGYETARDVWTAVGTTPGLAVVDAYVAPRRDQWGFGVITDFRLSGFYIEDGAFEPVPVTVHDPLTNSDTTVTVIGVLSDSAPFSMSGITVSQATLSPFGERANPTIHHLAVRDGADLDAVAAAIEAALLSQGVEAETYVDILDEAVGGSMLFVRLVQGFMSLGLVVGVAALGVISARAVVERRQHLGMLRAIGFQPEMIRRTLLAETSMIAFTAILVGGLLGLVLSYNVIADSKSQPGYASMDFAVPWLNLAITFTLVIAAALITTLASARRATRIYPAEALRYQ